MLFSSYRHLALLHIIYKQITCQSCCTPALAEDDDCPPPDAAALAHRPFETRFKCANVAVVSATCALTALLRDVVTLSTPSWRLRVSAVCLAFAPLAFNSSDCCLVRRRMLSGSVGRDCWL